MRGWLWFLFAVDMLLVLVMDRHGGTIAALSWWLAAFGLVYSLGLLHVVRAPRLVLWGAHARDVQVRPSREALVEQFWGELGDAFNDWPKWKGETEGLPPGDVVFFKRRSVGLSTHFAWIPEGWPGRVDSGRRGG